MTWGQPGVSRKLRSTNGISNWGTGGQPVSVPITQTGILAALNILHTATPAFTPGTGSIAADVWGPWNAYTQHVLAPNGAAPVLQVSGYGLYLINLIKAAERGAGAMDVAAIAETNHGDPGDVYGASATTGTAAWRLAQTLPVSQRIRSLGGDVGYWPLQNPAMQLAYQFTPNSASSGSPYNVFSTQGGQSPYLVTGNATVTLATPTVEVYRDLFQVPASAQDLPPFNLISTWIEETPQGASVNGASTFSWQAQPLSGLLCRVIVAIFDGTTSNGVAAASLNQSNALQLVYDNNTPKFSESSYAALARARRELHFDMPQGVYYYDLLGPDLTLQDTMDTSTTANIKFIANLNTALGGTNSAAKILRQIISPLQVK